MHGACVRRDEAVKVARTFSFGEWLTHKNDATTMFMPMPGGVLVFVTVANAPARGCALHFVPFPDADTLWAFLAGIVQLPAPTLTGLGSFAKPPEP